MENADWKLLKVYMCVCVKRENNLEVARLGTVDRVGTPWFCKDSICRNESWRLPSISCRVITFKWLGTETFCNDSIHWNESWRSLLSRTSHSLIGQLGTLSLCNESWHSFKNAKKNSKSFLNNMFKRNEDKWYQK